MKILLVEPNYKNKYPPMGLMKIIIRLLKLYRVTKNSYYQREFILVELWFH